MGRRPAKLPLKRQSARRKAISGKTRLKIKPMSPLQKKKAILERVKKTPIFQKFKALYKKHHKAIRTRGEKSVYKFWMEPGANEISRQLVKNYIFGRKTKLFEETEELMNLNLEAVFKKFTNATQKNIQTMNPDSKIRIKKLANQKIQRKIAELTPLIKRANIALDAITSAKKVAEIEDKLVLDGLKDAFGNTGYSMYLEVFLSDLKEVQEILGKL